MRLNVAGNINHENAPKTFCKTCRQRTSKMRLNSTANSFVFGHKNRDNAPRTLLYTLQGENFQNASKLCRKQLHFWTHKL